MGYLTAIFNGTELPIMISKISRNLSPDFKNKITTIDNRSGATLEYSTQEERYIEIEYVINCKLTDLTDFRRTMGEILNTSETGELILSDEPTLYYNAIPDGEQTLEEDYPFSTGTIRFLVPDRLAHSVVTKTVTAEVSTTSSYTLEATIVNDGTASVPVSYEITHKVENGYIGIVSEYGIIQLGKASEADGETYEDNEVLTTSDSAYEWNSSDTGWVTDTGTNGQNSANKTSGTLSVVTVDGKKNLSLSAKGTSTSGTWNGAMKTYEVVDSSGNTGAVNFYCYVNSWFETGRMGQTGCQTICFLDEDDKRICWQSIFKTDTSGNTAYAYFGVGGNNPRTVLKKTFTPSNSSSQNPYRQASGHSDIKKEGSNIRFYWWGTYPTYEVPELAAKKVCKVQIYIGQYGTRAISTAQYVTRNYFRRVLLEVMGVEKWRNVPNRYQAGDVIYIDGETRKVYVNDMVKAGDEATGSVYFDVPPGETTVEFVYSDFCNIAPTITATIREAYV